MVKVLAGESARLGVPVLGAKILATDDEPKRVTGLLAFHAADRTADNPLGLVVIRCADLVITAGGPGELYRDSVYRKHCFGSLGLALEAGVVAINLTESQFGIGTPRDGFPWNLSGLPYIHSVGTDGIERNFLGDYTLLSELRDIAYQNKRVIYDLLMKAAAETTLAIAADSKRLGARIGITAVLHTRGSALTHHPHVHMIVPGVGLSFDGARWVASRSDFLQLLKWLALDAGYDTGNQLDRLNSTTAINVVSMSRAITDRLRSFGLRCCGMGTSVGRFTFAPMDIISSPLAP